jgi:myosin V
LTLVLLEQYILTLSHAGLQTPRLKRLAEIVSAQAIAQQEKHEYPNGEGEGYPRHNDLAEVEEGEAEE